MHAITKPDGNSVNAIELKPNQAMFLPITQLQRVFLGIGWAEKDRAQGVVDVDCSAVCYSQGTRRDGDTVWWGNLRNGRSMVDDGAGGKTEASTIVHTGDVLTGQQGGELEDQERPNLQVTSAPQP